MGDGLRRLADQEQATSLTKLEPMVELSWPREFCSAATMIVTAPSSRRTTARFFCIRAAESPTIHWE